MHIFKVLPVELYEILIKRAETSELKKFNWVISTKQANARGDKPKWIQAEKRFKITP